MKLARILIKPESSFSTNLKGDTLFGHICWQIAYDDKVYKKGMDTFLENYQKKPTLIVSSPWPCIEFENQKGKQKNEWYAFSRPFGAQIFLNIDKNNNNEEKRIQNLKDRKKFKNKKWILTDKSLSLNIKKENFIDANELLDKKYKSLNEPIDLLSMEQKKLFKTCETQHNSINRTTFTTGSGDGFAPFTTQNTWYHPKTIMAVFVMYDPNEFSKNNIEKAFSNIGSFGYGKDATQGKGKFTIYNGLKDLDMPDFNNCQAVTTIGPCLPKENNCFFNPHINFGKHGDIAALSGNPFKNPVILADEGAMFMTDSLDKETYSKGYLGSYISNPSKNKNFGEKCIHQGYSICLPVTNF